MPVTEIYILRHGHRLAWSLNPSTGRYSSTHPFPTRLPADPPLASHGVRQAQETSRHLGKLFADLLKQDRLRIYTSLYYRCLETLRPTVEALLRQIPAGDAQKRKGLAVRGERGLGEWFGRAWFVQPSPADAGRLRREFFPWVDEGYHSRITPPEHGERLEELHDRVARTLAQIVKDVDEEFVKLGRAHEEVTILISGHAAPIIASGRVLTGEVPDDWDEEDFHCFTCGLSKFVRRQMPPSTDGGEEHEQYYDTSDWRSSSGQGLAGGWDCVLNSDCSHLTQGEERGWHFHGDESFDTYGNIGIKVSDGSVHESKL